MRFHSKLGHKAESINVVLRTNLSVTSRCAIGTGLIEQVNKIVAQTDIGKKILLLCQTGVRQLYAEPVLAQLQNAGYDCTLHEMPDGEQCKSHDQVFAIWQLLQEKNFSRRDCIVAVGGGALTDVAGFAASTYLRGIKLVLVPTTLLAQVDASIGGKTGVNLPAGKNLAGAFYFPEVVIVDPGVIRSLPELEFRSGLGEIIKYGLIELTIIGNTEFRGGQRSLFKVMEDAILPGDFTADSDYLEGIVTSCVKMKLAVVGKDPLEGKLRRCLNLGHTLGHAIEKVTNYSVTHGEGVAIGTVFACKLSSRLNKFEQADLERVTNLISNAKLPIEVPSDLKKDELAHAMGFDKKRETSGIKFVLPIKPLGAVDLDANFTPEQLAEVL